MTGRRVLKGAKSPLLAATIVSAGTVDHESGFVGDTSKPPTVEAKQSTSAKLQQVVTLLSDVKKLNEQVWGQYGPGSAAWGTCETIDDKLHEVFVLLGE